MISVDADEPTKRYQILVALMLSSQTKDEITYAACQRLKTVGFTSQSLASIEVSDLEKLLYPVGFYKTKAKNIKKASQIILDEYNAEIPDTLETLMKLPGVGPKMASLNNFMSTLATHKFISHLGSYLYEFCI